MQILAQREDGIRIIRILSRKAVDEWRAAFAGTYQEVWSEAPYYERFFPDEAEGVFRRTLHMPDNLTVLGVRETGLVVGFGMGYPVVGNPAVVRDVRGLLPIEHTFYFADLGVLEPWRRRGIGRQLIDLRLSLIDRSRFAYVLLRISAVKDAVYDMYRRIGFEDTGVYTEVAYRRMDGATRTDRRVYLSLGL